MCIRDRESADELIQHTEYEGIDIVTANMSLFGEMCIRDRYYILTPLECERLQTLPDNYTEGVSNTQDVYKRQTYS